MSSFRIDDMMKRIEDALAMSKDGFAVAILCDHGDPFGRELYDRLSERPKGKPVMLDPEAEKHMMKRELNHHGCELIVYTDSFAPRVYELFNDGTTLLHDSLIIDDYVVS